jgi:hypothetical protein
MVQLLATQAQNPETWRMVTSVAAILFYFGWFQGSNLTQGNAAGLANYDTIFPASFEVLLWSLVLLPFLQSRLATNSWIPKYDQLFSYAWRNKLTLAEAGLFTGLFWALLGLWQVLFHLLSIDYFRDLFREPIFIYPITALVFGIALHLIGSLGQWTRVVLEQILSVLKWLAPVAAFILALFSIALVPKLTTLVFSGNRAISAGWLLWLVAVVVLLTNAAFRDGSLLQPYPKALGRGLRYVMPLLILVALTAAYALVVRTREYGVTVERYWALIVATFTVIYSLGYSWAAFDERAWMGRIAPVNIGAALLILVVLFAALTTIATPYRLAADSQYRRALRGMGDTEPRSVFTSRGPLEYLRFNAGAYGIARLRELANDRSLSADLQSRAARTLSATPPLGAAVAFDPNTALSKLVLYPSGTKMPPELQEALQKDLHDRTSNVEPLAGLFADLDADGADEFVLLWTNTARVYKQDSGHWRWVGDMVGGGDVAATVMSHLAGNEVRLEKRKWEDLQIGQRWYHFAQEPKSPMQ